MNITFDKSVKELILQAFDKSIDDEKYIIDNATKERVQTLNGEEIHIDNFGGFRKGSVILLKSDLPTYIEIADKLAS